MSIRGTAIIGVLIALAATPLSIRALTAAEIQKQIDDSNGKIQQLDSDIEKFEKQLDTISDQKQTLQSKIDGLNVSIKRTSASISKSREQVSRTQLEIQQLSSDIGDKQELIKKDTFALMESLRRLDETERTPFVVALLSGGALSDVWKQAEAHIALQNAVNQNIERLSQEKVELEDAKDKTETKKSQLVREQNELIVEQGSLNAVKRSQSDLLTQTKSQENAYQKLLAQKKAAKAAFEDALADLQSKLEYAVDSSKIPTAGKGILSWPVDNVRITQYFGNTEFAKSGAYNGKGHNGIDVAAPVGAPLKAALSGTVAGTGNTDAVKGCYSFGKWVLINHNNGLSTMYAHLSQISVGKGEQVSTGQLIGYTGETGYATGPHLHFGVYVSQAVQIVQLGSATKSKTACANAVMPIAPLQAYLNPMDYL